LESVGRFDDLLSWRSAKVWDWLGGKSELSGEGKLYKYEFPQDIIP